MATITLKLTYDEAEIIREALRRSYSAYARSFPFPFADFEMAAHSLADRIWLDQQLLEQAK